MAKLYNWSASTPRAAHHRCRRRGQGQAERARRADPGDQHRRPVGISPPTPSSVSTRRFRDPSGRQLAGRPSSRMVAAADAAGGHALRRRGGHSHLDGVLPLPPGTFALLAGIVTLAAMARASSRNPDLWRQRMASRLKRNSAFAAAVVAMVGGGGFRQVRLPRSGRHSRRSALAETRGVRLA